MIFRLGLAFLCIGALANALECYVGSSIKDNVEATQCKEGEQACVTDSRLVNGLSNNNGRNLTYTKRCAKSCAEVYQHFPSWISADGKTWITERDANIRTVCCEFKKCNRATTFFGDSWPDEEASATKPGIKCYSGWEEKKGRDMTQVVQCPNQRACLSIAEPIYPHYGFKEPESVTKSCAYSCAVFDRKIHLQHAKGYFSDVAFVSRNQTDKSGRRWWQTEMQYEDEHGQNQTFPTRTMCCEKGFCNEDTIYYSETWTVLDHIVPAKLNVELLVNVTTKSATTTTDATSESTTTEETAETIASPGEENGTNRPIHMLSVSFGLIAISLLI